MATNTSRRTASAGGKKTSGKSKAASKGWVKHVAETSDAMDLKQGLFKESPKKIARGLKKSVEESDRTKGTKFQSAMSMLNFYENRGGKGLSKADKDRLEKAKPELRKAFGRDPEKGSAKGSSKTAAKSSKASSKTSSTTAAKSSRASSKRSGQKTGRA